MKVHGGSHHGRVWIAGLVCYKPGERSRLIYRLHLYRRRKGERVGFTLGEYRRLLQAAHQQLPGGNIVLVWDNSNIHRSAAMKSFIADHADWLRVFHLPAYAPELNPAEGIWSLLKRSITNFLASEGSR